MRISYLELRNYRRFKHLSLQLPDGIVGIIGPNGSGKTTVIEGIAWALFGNVEEVVRTSRESVRSMGASASENCVAIVEFELGGVEYRIRREMGGKSLSMRAELRTADKVVADGDKAVKKKVEQLLGMDHKSFFTSVFARQKELNALQNVQAGERKKTVLRMLRIDGIDEVISAVRSDRKDIAERIKGAESTLLDDDGRDRERILADRIPSLTQAKEAAEHRLIEAEQIEQKLVEKTDRTKAKRDQLKRDFDALNQAGSELAAKRAAIGVLISRRDKTAARIREAEGRLRQLPQLEESERQWQEVSRRKEHLDKEKSKADQARHLRADIDNIEAELREISSKIADLKSSIAKLPDFSARLDELTKKEADCHSRRAAVCGELGTLRATITDRTKVAERDRKKLDEILGLGREGRCPTCERTLEDAFELLVGKLQESIDNAEKEVSAAESRVAQLENELMALTRKEEALKKNRSLLDREIANAERLRASEEASRKEEEAARKRLADKKRSLDMVGPSDFYPDVYEETAALYDRLKPLHDSFIKLKGTEEELARAKRDFDEISGQIEKARLEEQAILAVVSSLEPKRDEYNKTIQELDQEMSDLNRASREVRQLTTERDRANAELNSTKKELEFIARTKKTIEEDRKRADVLALVEDVMVSFKDHLIAKIAPTLSELTSKSLDAMTEGRYSRVVLDDNYEMQLDDQGTLHPISRFSGGEADVANLALRLAISRVIAERTGVNPVNFLILDEIFGSLDPGRKRSVMSALAGLSAQFRQIFLITHIEDIKDMMGYVIRVDAEGPDTSSAQLLS